MKLNVCLLTVLCTSFISQGVLAQETSNLNITCSGSILYRVQTLSDGSAFDLSPERKNFNFSIIQIDDASLPKPKNADDEHIIRLSVNESFGCLFCKPTIASMSKDKISFAFVYFGKNTQSARLDEGSFELINVKVNRYNGVLQASGILDTPVSSNGYRSATLHKSFDGTLNCSKNINQRF